MRFRAIGEQYSQQYTRSCATTLIGFCLRRLLIEHEIEFVTITARLERTLKTIKTGDAPAFPD